MSKRSEINSDDYWDQRFQDDWEQCQGPQQSRFFARTAIENLPPWLLGQIRQEELTFADWGCAQGDGTEVLASYLDPNLLTGIDFSDVAISKASKLYPTIKFLTEDWLEPGANDTNYDIVFSSNTLEHFHQPYKVLQHLIGRSKKAVVLALPYRELDRIEEHFFSFLPENVPFQLSDEFYLVWSRVVDCQELPETGWSGEQIVLVYAKASWIESLKLQLSDVEIDNEDSAAEMAKLQKAIAKRDEELSSVKHVMTEQRSEISVLNIGWAERDKTISALQEKLTVAEEQTSKFRQEQAECDKTISDLQQNLSQIEKSLSWRLMTPFRLLKQRFQRR